jgi:CRP-like cAMP-binding protein
MFDDRSPRTRSMEHAHDHTLVDYALRSGLDCEQAQRLAALFEPSAFDVGEAMARQGEPLETFWFIESGLVRFFYTREDGREFNKSFIGARTFCGALSAYLTDGIAPYGIEALEPTRAWATRYAWVAALYDEDPSFGRFARRWVERLALKKERRERALLEEDATTRYLHFVREYPDLSARIPQYHIARYIGVTEVSLSRIRARLAGHG